MKRPSFILFAVFLLATIPARAQSPAPPPEKEAPPPGPMIARAPEFAHWVTTVEDKSFSMGKPVAGAEPKKAPQIKISVTKTGTIYYQEYLDFYSKPWKTWVSDSMQATIWPDSNALVIGATGDLRMAVNFAKTDFHGVDWVSEQNFVRIIEYRGKKCLAFSVKKSVEVPIQSPPPHPESPSAGVSFQPGQSPNFPLIAKPTPPPMRAVEEISAAVVDFETRMPLYAQKGPLTYSYEYLPPPQAMLQIPQDITKAVQRENAVNQDNARRVPRAY